MFFLRPRRLKEPRQQGDEAANLVQVQQHLDWWIDGPIDGPIDVDLSCYVMGFDTKTTEFGIWDTKLLITDQPLFLIGLFHLNIDVDCRPGYFPIAHLW